MLHSLRRNAASLSLLRNQLTAKDALILPLPHRLLSEPTPSPERSALRTDWTRSVVNLAYHSSSKPTQHSTGFFIQTAIEAAPVLVTCAHVLTSVEVPDSEAEESSISILSRASKPAREIGVVSSLLGGTTYDDFLLLEADMAPDANVVPLAVDPYPISSPSAYTFFDQEDSPREIEIVGYRNSFGREAQIGTYDELALLDFSPAPTDGTSGAPIISPAGAVVGLVRGRSFKHGDRRQLGFAAPSEKLGELFQLLPSKNAASSA